MEGKEQQQQQQQQDDNSSCKGSDEHDDNCSSVKDSGEHDDNRSGGNGCGDNLPDKCFVSYLVNQVDHSMHKFIQSGRESGQDFWYAQVDNLLIYYGVKAEDTGEPDAAPGEQENHEENLEDRTSKFNSQAVTIGEGCDAAKDGGGGEDDEEGGQNIIVVPTQALANGDGGNTAKPGEREEEDKDDDEKEENDNDNAKEDDADDEDDQEEEEEEEEEDDNDNAKEDDADDEDDQQEAIMDYLKIGRLLEIGRLASRHRIFRLYADILHIEQQEEFQLLEIKEQMTTLWNFLQLRNADTEPELALKADADGDTDHGTERQLDAAFEKDFWNFSRLMDIQKAVGDIYAVVSKASQNICESKEDNGVKLSLAFDNFTGALIKCFNFTEHAEEPKNVATVELSNANHQLNDAREALNVASKLEISALKAVKEAEKEELKAKEEVKAALEELRLADLAKVDSNQADGQHNLEALNSVGVQSPEDIQKMKQSVDAAAQQLQANLRVKAAHGRVEAANLRVKAAEKEVTSTTTELEDANQNKLNALLGTSGACERILAAQKKAKSMRLVEAKQAGLVPEDNIKDSAEDLLTFFESIIKGNGKYSFEATKEMVLSLLQKWDSELLTKPRLLDSFRLSVITDK